MGGELRDRRRDHCVYLAPDAEAVREHARTAGFPADSVDQIRAAIGPGTAESIQDR